MTDSDPTNPFANLPRKPFDLSQFRSTPEYLRLRPQYVGAQGKYQIGELGFSRKDDVRRYIAAIRRDYAWKSDITDEPALGDLRVLFAMHRDYGREEPAGFRVVPHPNGAGWGMHLAFVRADGTAEVFGVDGCLGEINYHENAKTACRGAITADRNALVEAYYDEHADGEDSVRCHSSGCTKMVSKSEVHVDHAGPLTFEVIFLCWVASRRIDLETFTHKPPGSMLGAQIRDPELRYDWVEYHREVAPLRLLCPGCNFLASIHYRVNKDDRRLVLPEGWR